MRNLWPGNVEQLYQVLRTTMARRRSGTIELADLPPECRATTRRVLTPLEAIECDAIVEALLDTDGNKAEAARQLGMDCSWFGNQKLTSRGARATTSAMCRSLSPMSRDSWLSSAADSYASALWPRPGEPNASR